MMKFTDKSPHPFSLAHFYSVAEALDKRVADLMIGDGRFNTMRSDFRRLVADYKKAYGFSQKSHLTSQINQLTRKRDLLVKLMMRVAKQWEGLLADVDDQLAIHGQRISQVFKNYDLRINESLIAENVKLENIGQALSKEPLIGDLAAMGLTEINRRVSELTQQIKALMKQRNEEKAAVGIGHMKKARQALEDQYRLFISYMNALQAINPNEKLSQAAQYFNEDLRKVELLQLQSRKKNKSEEPATHSDEKVGSEDEQESLDEQIGSEEEQACLDEQEGSEDENT